MANILINGFSAKAGGGKVLFEKFLKSLYFDNDPVHHYYVITSNAQDYSEFNNTHVTVVETPLRYQKSLYLPWFYFMYIPALVKENSLDGVFNFADLILPVRIPQIYFFDWAYFVYPESVVWQRMTFKDLLIRKVKTAMIKAGLKYVDKTLAQTQTMAKRLNSFHGLTDIDVIPSTVIPVSPEKLRLSDSESRFVLPSKRNKLLFLSNFAPHKNFAIIIPLARLMKRHQSNFSIVTTLELDEHKEARELFKQLGRDGTSEYVTNIGRISPLDVNYLFSQCEGLFFPTLLESYGLPFIEAMQNGKPIFTSDFDFTRDVCGESACYFDPLNPQEAFDVINNAFSNPEVIKKKLQVAERILADLPDWNTVYRSYKKSITGVCQQKCL